MPFLGHLGKILHLDRKQVDRLADALAFRFDWSSNVDCRTQALKLLNVYCQRANNYVLDKARAFTQSCNKKLLVVLNYTARRDFFRNMIVLYDGVRNDQEILDHLGREGFDYFDMNAVHQREYEKTGGSYSEYMSQYHVGRVGHYNPRGNHFFAYSIKDKLLAMLDPKPLPYQDREAGTIDFGGYLPGT